MKIIGQTPTGVVAELTEGDLAALVGESYFSSKECAAKLAEIGLRQAGRYHEGDRWVVGATVDLAGRFNRVKQMEYRHAELKGTSKTLRQLADLMDHLGDAVIVPPKEEAK